MPDIEIEIDGKKIKTQAGKMLIQVADENNIYIPRFCYHKKLSIAANCRMCLVEVEKAPKTLPACATPINDGMRVFTQSAKTLESQRAVMEFLLINHPLDCPICDQGGQCELQDFSLQYAKDHSDYREEKRVVQNDDFGPLIATEMTRCIQCTRCVRFGKEILGVQEIGVMNRGEHEQIGTYVQHTLSHEMSANIIDLCPVGALLSKPFLYRARAWELNAVASIAGHDGIGSHVFVHVRRGEVMRVVPRENEEINENWLSDRDRFSYQGLHVDRLEKPMIKDRSSGEWREVTWQTALNFTADALEKIKAAHGKDAIGTFLSPSSTLEEAYLLKRLSEHVDSSQIEYRHRLTSSFQAAPGLGLSLADIEHQKNIYLVGAHLRNDQPILAHRLRKAALNGANIHVIDSVRHPYAFDLASEKVVKPSQIIQALVETLESLETGSLIIMGEYALNHPDADSIYTVLSELSHKTHSHLAVLPEGANALGCHQVGAWTPVEKKKKSLKAYILHGIEPEFDVSDVTNWQDNLLSADLVVAVTPFISDNLKQLAHIVLPSATFSETSGTFVNLAGCRQSFMGCVSPKGEARPAWKIFRVLGNLLGLKNCNFESSEDVLKECMPTLKHVEKITDMPITKEVATVIPGTSDLELIIWWPDCRSDALLRRSMALNQRAAFQKWDAARIHPETAEKYCLEEGQAITLKQGDTEFSSYVAIDEEIIEGAVLLAAGAPFVSSASVMIKK